MTTNTLLPLREFFGDTTDILRLRDEKLQPKDRMQLETAVRGLAKSGNSFSDRLNLVFYEALLNKDSDKASNHFKRLSAVCLAHAARLDKSSTEELLGTKVLQAKITELETLIAERENAQREAILNYTSISEQNETLANRQKELAQEIEDLTKARDEARSDAASLKAKVEGYEAKIAAQEIWAANMHKANSDRHAEFLDLRKELQEITRDKNAEIELLGVDNDRLKNELEAASKSPSTQLLQDKVDQLERDHTRLQDANTRLSADFEVTSKQLAESVDRNKILQGHIAELEEKLCKSGEERMNTVTEAFETVQKADTLESMRSGLKIISTLLETVEKVIPDIDPEHPDNILVKLAFDRIRSDVHTMCNA